MKAKELMIGDWVIFKAETPKMCKVVSIDTDNGNYIRQSLTDTYYTEDCFEPIPITAEILEKSGFERQQLNKYQTQCTFSDCHCSITVTFLDALVLGNEERGAELTITGAMFHIDMEVEYVHQLQSALRLVGIEKEVKI